MRMTPLGAAPAGVTDAADSAVRRRRPRPLWLTRQPLPLAEQNGRPALGGALTLGPERERVQGGWWEGADLARDYFVARTADGERVVSVERLPDSGGSDDDAVEGGTSDSEGGEG